MKEGGGKRLYGTMVMLQRGSTPALSSLIVLAAAMSSLALSASGRRVLAVVDGLGRRVAFCGSRGGHVARITRPRSSLVQCSSAWNAAPRPLLVGTRLPLSTSAANGASMRSSASESEEEEYDFDVILPFEKNTHNSVKIIVDEPGEGEDVAEIDDPYSLPNFHSKLEATVATARQLGKTAIWLAVPITRARLIEEAAKAGFEFHHAEGRHATLNRWLLEDEESRIPSFATHQVGVGAIVINPETDEILCVREKRRNYRPWKIPGGLAELGEDLDEAVIREVLEETGIECRFQSVLGVRHVHGAQFGRSDLFFVCRLEPIPNEDGKVPQPVPQEGEIEAASWLPLNEYRDMVQSDDSKIGHPMMSQIMKCVDSSSNIQRMIVPSVVPGRKLSPLYHAPIDDE